MLTIEYALNPIYTNEDSSSITLDVKFVEFDEVFPFSATPHDPMPYGVELYERAKVGEFGAVAPYVAPVITQPQTKGAQTL